MAGCGRMIDSLASTLKSRCRFALTGHVLELVRSTRNGNGWSKRLPVIAVLAAMLFVPALLIAEAPKLLDPGAWGADHVGKPLPEFTSGDECLFCHRMDVGPTWSTNRHGQTIRPADPQSAPLVVLKKLTPLAAE